MTLSYNDLHGVRSLLRQTERVSGELELALTRQTQFSAPYSQVGRSAGETPLYFDDGASVVARRIHQALVDLVKAVRCECQSPYAACHLAPLIGSMTSFVGARIMGLVGLDEGVVEQLRAAVTDAGRVIDVPPQRIYLGDCKACGAKLYGDPEQDLAECPACACEYEPYLRRQENQERGQDMLVTAAMAHKYIGEVLGIALTVNRIRVWAARGKFEERGISPGLESRRTKLYRLGDIVACARQASNEGPSKSVRT